MITWQKDTLTIWLNIVNKDKSPKDITGATVECYIGLPDGSKVKPGTAIVLDAEAGRISAFYPAGAADLGQTTLSVQATAQIVVTLNGEVKTFEEKVNINRSLRTTR